MGVLCSGRADTSLLGLPIRLKLIETVSQQYITQNGETQDGRTETLDPNI